jgi:two-component system, cell cycle response regulator DivK
MYRFNDFSYLYVEDDESSRKVISLIMVQVMGVERLTIFEDSHNFAERLAALPVPPDVILLDIHVKPLSGFDLLKLVRESPDHCLKPVIALTASVMNEEVIRLRASGFDGAIAKPLRYQTFPDLLTRVLRGEQIWHVA